MGKLSFYLVLSVAAMVGLGEDSSALVAAEATGPSPLVVVVDDRAQILPRVLDQAEKEAARIYWQAGVKAEWLTPSALTRAFGDDENLPPARQAFTVRLIIQAHLRATRTTSKFLMGAAPATEDDCGGAVYVFYDQVTGFSNVQQMDAALVLGTVIAHEIGHLLLQHDGHSAEGLMRASWDSSDWHRASRGFLLFAPPDGATIRATISSCRR